MALTNLYPPSGKIIHSCKNWAEGVAEIGGPEKVAQLWQVQEERPKMNNGGVDIYGRVAEGLIVIPQNYGMFKPGRALVRKGLPLLDPQSATDANKNSEWYSPNIKQYSAQLLDVLTSAFPIDEARVKDNALELMFANFESDPVALFLYGGDGTEEQIKERTRQTRNYLITAFKNANKLNQSVRVYLLPIESAKKEIVGSQFFSGGLGGGCGLDGLNGCLDLADGVFGVGD